MFEIRVLRRIFGQKRIELTGGWRKLHNEDLYLSPSLFKLIRSKRMRWTKHIARMGKKWIEEKLV
jgi:hypothetical protein